jgi:hypothetical protein
MTSLCSRLGVIIRLLLRLCLLFASSIAALADLHVVLFELQNNTLPTVRTIYLLEVVIHLQVHGIHKRRVNFWYNLRLGPLATSKHLLIIRLPL